MFIFKLNLSLYPSISSKREGGETLSVPPLSRIFWMPNKLGKISRKKKILHKYQNDDHFDIYEAKPQGLH